MAAVVLELTDEDQKALLALVDAVLKAHGRAALKAALHWENKLALAQASAAQTPEGSPDG